MTPNDLYRLGLERYGSAEALPPILPGLLPPYAEDLGLGLFLRCLGRRSFEASEDVRAGGPLENLQGRPLVLVRPDAPHFLQVAENYFAARGEDFAILTPPGLPEPFDQRYATSTVEIRNKGLPCRAEDWFAGCNARRFFVQQTPWRPTRSLAALQHSIYRFWRDASRYLMAELRPAAVYTVDGRTARTRAVLDAAREAKVPIAEILHGLPSPTYALAAPPRVVVPDTYLHDAYRKWHYRGNIEICPGLWTRHLPLPGVTPGDETLLVDTWVPRVSHDTWGDVLDAPHYAVLSWLEGGYFEQPQLRPHPMLQDADFRQTYRAYLDDRPLSEALSSARLVVGSNSTTLYQAALVDRPVIALRSPAIDERWLRPVHWNVLCLEPNEWEQVLSGEAEERLRRQQEDYLLSEEVIVG